MTDYYEMAADAELYYNYLDEIIKYIENMAPVTTTMPANTTISDWLMNPASCPDFHAEIESYDDPDLIKGILEKGAKSLKDIPAETPVNLTEILKQAARGDGGLWEQRDHYYDRKNYAEMMAETENDEYY